MLFLLFIVFLVLAFSTGAHAYVYKNTLAHWLVAMLSAFASVVSAWTAVYYAIRFFLDPSRIVLDVFSFKLSMAFANHPSSDIVVFGHFWLIALVLPLLVACIAARELRKVPQMQDTPQASTSTDAPNAVA